MRKEDISLEEVRVRTTAWSEKKVPKRAPTRPTRPSKTGTADAITYANATHTNTHDNHVIQWVGVFAVR